MHTNDHDEQPGAACSTAQLIRQARRLKQLNQAEFARLVGKSQGMVSRYESGESVPPGDVIMHCMHDPMSGESHDAQALALAQVRQAAESLLEAISALQHVGRHA